MTSPELQTGESEKKSLIAKWEIIFKSDFYVFPFKLTFCAVFLFASASLLWGDYTVQVNGNNIEAKDDVTGLSVYSGTDATTAIQSCIDVATSGGKIFLGSATYVLSGGLNISRDNITLEGAGFYKTTLRLDNNVNQNVVSFTGTSRNYCAIRNLTIDGNRDYNTQGSGIYGPMYRCLVEDVRFYRIPEYGIYSTDSGSANRIIRALVEQAGTGISLGAHSSWVTDCTVCQCSATGIEVRADSTKINQTHFWGNKVNITIGSTKTLLTVFICDNFLELNTTTEEGIKIGPYSIWGGVVSGNYFRRNTVGSPVNTWDDISNATQNSPYAMSGLNINGNVFSGASYSRNNIFLGPRSQNNIVSANTFASVSTPINNYGTGNYINGNKAYVTENSGNSTINAGQTILVVSHGLALTPKVVQVTPTGNTVGKRFWISDKGTMTFTINIDSAHSAAIPFNWLATAE